MVVTRATPAYASAAPVHDAPLLFPRHAFKDRPPPIMSDLAGHVVGCRQTAAEAAAVLNTAARIANKHIGVSIRSNAALMGPRQRKPALVCQLLRFVLDCLSRRVLFCLSRESGQW